MSDQRDDAVASRAAPRQSWPVRTHRLGAEPSDDSSDVTTPQQRLEMMWPLTLEAWALTGKALPEYDRSSAPVRRFLRRTSRACQDLIRNKRASNRAKDLADLEVLEREDS